MKDSTQSMLIIIVNSVEKFIKITIFINTISITLWL